MSKTFRSFFLNLIGNRKAGEQDNGPWKADSPLHGGSDDGADPGAGTCTSASSAGPSLTAKSVLDAIKKIARLASQGPAGAILTAPLPFPIYQAAMAQMQADQQKHMAGQIIPLAASFTAVGVGKPEPEPEPIKMDGVEIGEVIAWRAWAVHDGWLYSIHKDGFEWEPGGVVEAHKVGIPLGEGIHAFKTRRRAISEYSDGDARIIGRVAMWGELYEFEHGWHGEFARVHSLDWETEGADIDKLRETYGVKG